MRCIFDRLIMTGLFCAASVSVIASSPPLLDIKIDRSTAALQRGAELILGKCRMCHDLQYVKYRNLKEIGFTEEQVKTMRGDHEPDAPVLSMMASDVRQDMFGMMPPDLTLIARARRGGEPYIYSFLLGFSETEDGTVANRYFPGTKMPDPLGISYAVEESQRQVINQQATDIVSFLSWSADPYAKERHTLGYYVIAYLVLLTLLLYLLKRRVWSRLDQQD